MDYLKEGINLRAMGQKDPLTEWQREGYEMFGQMMKGIAQDFVRYVMHVQVVQQPAAAPAAPVTEQSGPAEPGTGPATAVEPAPASSPVPADAPAASSARSGAPAPAPAPSNGVRNLQTSSSDTEQAPAFQRAAASAVAAGEAPAEILRATSSTRIDQVAGGSRQGNRPAKQETVVKDEWAKTPRNAPCPCGSGKKFKMCHGA
jgi:preprotein translocase subunit SecA